MKCRIRAFGISRDIIGQRDLLLDLPQVKSAGDLKEYLYASYPGLANLKSLFIALNNEYAEDGAMLKDGDEIALIPPVSGG
jgi:molybdopterin synthase sulfur carrier subunit